MLENRKRVWRVEYDFARDGGAVGDITLRGPKLQSGAVIDIGKITVLTDFTSGGLATVALKVKTAEDVLAAAAVADMDAGVKDVVPAGTAATCIQTTAIAEMVMTVAEAALTAGAMVVDLEYYLLD